MATYKTKVSFQIGRLKGVLNALKRSKRGMLGVAVLIFFILMALTASMLSPYDPVYSYYVGGDFAVPVWFRLLPGGESLSENLIPVAESFSTNTSLYGESAKFTFASSHQRASLQYNSSIGYRSPGSASIVFERDKDTLPLGEVKVNLTTQFSYPFGGPPMIFNFTIHTSTQGTGMQVERYWGNVTLLDVPVRIKVFIEQVGGEPFDLWEAGKGTENTQFVGPKHCLWDSKKLTSIPAEKPRWAPTYYLSSYNSKVTFTLLGEPDPAAMGVDWEAVIFPKEGEYVYSIEILFEDKKSNKDVKTVVYIDDVYTRFYGTAFGLLGTDQYGRDIFTQLVHGSRISLFIGLLAAAMSVTIGLVYGLASGYLGGIADEIMMRFNDALLVLPGLPLLLVLIAVLGPTARIFNIVILIGFLGWMGFARVVRSQVLSLKERPFIEAAKAVGAGKIHIITRHILPNVMSLVYVTLATSVPGAILLEAAISWLGLYDPSAMSWGRMLHDVTLGGSKLVGMWWWVLPPGLSIAAVSLSFILLGYTLDEILNPKLRRRR